MKRIIEKNQLETQFANINIFQERFANVSNSKVSECSLNVQNVHFFNYVMATLGRLLW